MVRSHTTNWFLTKNMLGIDPNFWQHESVTWPRCSSCNWWTPAMSRSALSKRSSFCKPATLLPFGQTKIRMTNWVVIFTLCFYNLSVFNVFVAVFDPFLSNTSIISSISDVIIALTPVGFKNITRVDGKSMVHHPVVSSVASIHFLSGGYCFPQWRPSYDLYLVRRRLLDLPIDRLDAETSWKLTHFVDHIT